MKKVIYSIIIFLLVFISQIYAQDSMYVHLKTGIAKFLISDIDSVKFEKTSVIQYNYFISKDATSPFIHYRTSIPMVSDANDFEIAYDGTASINLNNLVLATASNGSIEKQLADYGFTDFKFEFSLPTYIGLDGITNQNAFVTLNSTSNSLTIVGGTSSIDRTPLVVVKLKSTSGNLLAQAYIKFKIVNSSTPPNSISKEYTMSNISYASLFKGVVAIESNFTDFKVGWSQMNELYNSMGITHDEFQAVYGSISPTVSVKVNNNVVDNATLSQYPLIRSMTAPDVDTYAMKCQITPLAKFGTTAVTYTFTPGNTSYPILNITFNYTVVKPTIKILDAFQNPDANSIMSYGMKTTNEYLMQVYLGEGFGYDKGEYARSFGSATANTIDGASHTFAFSASTPNQGLATLLPSTGGSINATLGSSTSYNSGQLLKLTSQMNSSTLTFNMEFITNFPNGEKYVFPFNVTFKNPITIESTTGFDITLTDFNSGVCDEKQVALSNNVKVKFLGQDFIVNGVPTSTATTYGITASNYSFGITPNPAFAYAITLLNPNAAMSTVKWCNAGTKLNSKVLAGTIGPSFISTFAKVSNTVHNVYVQPQ